MRKFLIILIAVILAVFAGIFYLNQSASSAKIKAAIVNNLQTATGKKVLLGSVRFDIFKGLVLKDLIIRDELNAIINVKEVRCRFLISGITETRDVCERRKLYRGALTLLRGGAGLGQGPVATHHRGIMHARLARQQRASLIFGGDNTL